MLYQARAQYENGNLEEARKILRKALMIAPWNHRIRFNLASSSKRWRSAR